MRTYCVILLVSSGFCLSERELAILGSAARARPNTLINGFHASVFEVSEERAGLVTLRTNTRPGYMDPASAGYPRDRDLEFNVNKFPTYASRKTCVPTNEPLGVTIYGTVIYSVSLPQPGCPQADAAKVRNGIPDGDETTEIDECGGHVSLRDMFYRVYMWSSCLQNLTCGRPSDIIGVALDGFPIYGPIDETGRQLTTADLDECHGRLASDGSYRYHTTVDYPYTVSCFKGVIHPDVGITYPIKCTCPGSDIEYLDPSRIPFINYTIGYEWVPLWRKLSLFPCEECNAVQKGTNVSSWLNYKQLQKKIEICNITTHTRFVQVIKRRLADGRLSPNKEYDYYLELRHRNSNKNVKLVFNSSAQRQSTAKYRALLLFIFISKWMHPT